MYEKEECARTCVRTCLSMWARRARSALRVRRAAVLSRNAAAEEEAMAAAEAAAAAAAEAEAEAVVCDCAWITRGVLRRRVSLAS